MDTRSPAQSSAAALGRLAADLILTDCRLVNVYTRETEDAEIAIRGSRISYVGSDASHARGSSTKILNMRGKYAAPGLADPHIHIDSFLSPSEFAARALLCGTTSIFADPIDITTVCGYEGFSEFAASTSRLPIRVFSMVPGGIPVDPDFGDAKPLTQKQLRMALKLDGVLGLGEVFSWTKVLGQDPATMRAIERMLEADCIINGHTAGASGKKLQAYISAGISSCHEPISFEQVLERLKLGMWIMIREGSIRRDLSRILPELLRRKMPIERLMFCADEINPADLAEHGHIDHCIRQAVSLGMEPADAITAASRNSFDYYGMGRDLGGIGPGKLADIVIFDDLESFRPETVLVNGRVAVSGGVLTEKIARYRPPPRIRDTVKLEKMSARDFAVPAEKGAAASTILMNTEIITGMGSRSPDVRRNNALASREDDLWKVAAIDRIRGTGQKAIGFLENFGADIGAVASTRAFHENDMLVIGASDAEMAAAVNHTARMRGGITVVRNGRVAASVPLDIAGIASSRPFEDVAAGMKDVSEALSSSKFADPLLIPTFLSFLALPSVRIIHSGIIDVKRRKIIPALQSG